MARTNPTAKKSGPITVARDRNMAPHRMAAMAGTRRWGASMVTIERRRLAAIATVAPTTRATAVIVVTTRFSLVTKNTMYAEYAVIGVCSAMEMTTTRTTAMTRRSIMASRPG